MSMPSTLRRLYLFAIVVLGSLAFPGLARATNYTVCARLTTTFENVGGGEDYITDADGPYTAMYQKVSISRLGVPYVNGYLSSTGCVTFSSPYADNYLIYFYSELQVPRTDNAAQTNIARITDSSSAMAAWGYAHTFVGTSKTFDIPAAWPTNLLVASRQSLVRFSNGISGKTFLVKDQGCPGSVNSCNDSDYEGDGTATATIYIHPNHNGRKYAIAHEIGHAETAHYFGDYPHPLLTDGSAYAYNGGGTSCQWSGAGEHMIHSMEYAAGGLVEGFAQYYATFVFNSEATTDAYFYYYKDGTGVSSVDMESGPVGGVTAYMDNTCTGLLDGMGCEMDWARQLWDYRTDTGSKPSNGAILDQFFSAYGDPAMWRTGVNHPTTGDRDNTVNRLTSAISAYDNVHGTAFSPRWANTDDTNGVNHPDP